jgi:Xaa-Pro aminopeptidase
MPEIDYPARQMVLRERMAALNAVAVALVPGDNMLYFTGLELPVSERPTVALILADGGVAFIIPATEADQLDHLSVDVKAVFAWTDEEGYEGAFTMAAETFGFNTNTLGVDEITMRVFEFLAVQNAAPDIQIRSMGKTLLDIRG